MQVPSLDFKNNRNTNLLVVLFGLAIAFYILRSSEKTTLLAIMLIVVSIAVYATVYTPSAKDATNAGGGASRRSKRGKGELDLDEAIKDRMAVTNRAADPSKIYMIKSFPKSGLKYLREHEQMLKVAQNLLYLRVFDRARYQEVLLLMDRLQKVYIYILVGRYDCRLGFNLFMDIREMLREKLYSFYIVVPMRTKHMYGLDPHKELDSSITEFTVLTRKMIRVLENYARRECKTPYLDPSMPLAIDHAVSANTVP